MYLPIRNTQQTQTCFRRAQGTEWMPLEEGAEADFGEEYWRLPIPNIHNILASA